MACRNKFTLLSKGQVQCGVSGSLPCILLQDEKLHDVLGHFQKDFEGGVSAENLGKE